MEIRHARSAVDLAAQLHQRWAGPREDPFDTDLAVVPSPGFQRWLSQQLATADPQSGICAGIEFCSAGTLWTRLLGGENPWHPDNLTWTIHQLAFTNRDPELAVLAAHFAASSASYTAARQIAGQFSGYLRYALPLIDQWNRNEDVAIDGSPLEENSWQPILWRTLIAATGHDPVAVRQRILANLRSGPHPGLPERIAIVAPRRLDPAALELFTALGTHHQVDLLLLAPTVRRPAPPAPTAGKALLRSDFPRPHGHPLNRTLGEVCDENAALVGPPDLPDVASPNSLLGWLQSDLRSDTTPPPRLLSESDDSIQFHLSHGPARHIDILRDVLARLYTQHPDLQPRQIAVLTPDPGRYAPLLNAAFVEGPRVSGHPAASFRVQLGEQSVAGVNPLAQLLCTLLRLPESRFEATAIEELLSREPIARRFGLDDEARQRLTNLVAAAGIRWGLNASHRAEYGLNKVIHNTWQTGLQRLLLGVAMSDNDLLAVGTVLPVDDVDSSDIALIGALTEFIGRLSRWLATVQTPAPLSSWAERCRDLLNDITALAPTDEWQRSHLVTQLSGLHSDLPSVNGHVVTRQAFLDAVESRFAELPARAAFGNGNTLVTGLSSLADVPHRVIILLGWDADHYPRTTTRSGDDLLTDHPQIGTPSAAMSDRHALFSAAMAATDQLILICRGRSDATNEPVPLSAPIAELRDALNATAVTADGRPASEAVTLQHPLQPFGADYFLATSALPSIDHAAFRAAKAWQHSRIEPPVQPEKFHFGPLPPLPLVEGVSLNQVNDFYRHAARTLLRVRAGISLTQTSADPDHIPIELDALERWQVGNRILRHLREGMEPDRVERAEWLRGYIPPFELGRQVMGTAIADARRTLAPVPIGADPRHHDLEVTLQPPGLPEVHLTGQVTTIDSTIWLVEYSALQPRQKLTGWLQLLLLAAAKPGNWTAQIAAKGRRAAYAAPDARQARDLLARYLSIYALGMTRPLPLMPRLTAEWVNNRSAGRDPSDPYQQKGLRRCWDWESDPAWTKFFDYPDVLDIQRADLPIPGADPAEKTLVGALGSAIWVPINAAEVTP